MFGFSEASGGGALLNVQTFSVAGDHRYHATPGTKRICARVLGPGATGGTGSVADLGGGAHYGGGGGTAGCERELWTTDVSDQAVVVGASDGASTFGTLVSCGQGDTGFGGNITRYGGGGAGGTYVISTPTAAAGGRGGAPGSGPAWGGLGAPTGGASTPTVPGSPGLRPGEGGGGGNSGNASYGPTAGGAGAAGLVTVFEFA